MRLCVHQTSTCGPPPRFRTQQTGSPLAHGVDAGRRPGLSKMAWAGQCFSPARVARNFCHGALAVGRHWHSQQGAEAGDTARHLLGGWLHCCLQHVPRRRGLAQEMSRHPEENLMSKTGIIGRLIKTRMRKGGSK